MEQPGEEVPDPRDHAAQAAAPAAAALATEDTQDAVLIALRAAAEDRPLPAVVVGGRNVGERAAAVAPVAEQVAEDLAQGPAVRAAVELRLIGPEDAGQRPLAQEGGLEDRLRERG